MADIQREKPLPAFEDHKFYTVQLLKPTEYAGRVFSPSHKIIIRGDIAKAIAASIYTADEAKESS